MSSNSQIATRTRFLITITLVPLLLSACKVGPNYKPIPVTIPEIYKEGGHPPKGWKIARPADELDRGCWWEIFGNPELNALEAQLNITNQTIESFVGQYQQSLALVGEAQAAIFPVVSGFVSAMRQKPPASTFNSTSGTGTGGQAASPGKPTSLPPFSTYIISFNASWEPDLWGGIRRNIEASADNAQSSAAQIAAARLSAQSSLAQDYFQLRTLDSLQKLLDATVTADKNLLTLTQNRYKSGTVSLSDIAQAETNYQAAEAAAINNHIARAQFEHAIAVLIGVPPAMFSLHPKVLDLHPPHVPVTIPSELLERRPDIAQAERLAAAANAQIGVAIANFFPTLPLTASGGFQSNIFSRLLTSPSSFWMLGAQLMDTILDGGLRSAELAAARATYDQTVANYRQTVLVAFQNVEDGLAAERILKAEERVQKQAVATAKLSLRLQVNDYKAGTTDFTSVLVAQTTAFTVEENEINVVGRQMTTAASLIAALGGGWDVHAIIISGPPTP